MNHICLVPDHKGKPAKYVCLDLNCKENRLLCFTCLNSVHKNCLGSITEIESILARDSLSETNLIRDPETRKAISFVEREGTTQGDDHFFKKLEELLDLQAKQLIDNFTQKVIDLKDRTIAKIRNDGHFSNINYQQFIAKLNSLFNCDSLAGILQRTDEAKQDINSLNQQIASYLQQTDQREKQEAELKETAKILNSYQDCYRKINEQVFQDFQASIPFSGLQRSLQASLGPFSSRAWTWSTSQKSTVIELSEGNNKAVKKGCADSSAVLGNVEMKEGCNQWEIEVQTNTSEDRWICFGVVDTDLTSDLERLPAFDTIGLNTIGQSFGALSCGSLATYDKKVYLCELDFNKNVFSIYHEGQLICRTNGGLQSKTYVPFVILYYEGNAATLL